MIQRERQVPLVFGKGIQRSIVHTQHHIGTDRKSFAIAHTQGPLLCGTRLGIVAEGVPMHVEFGVGESLSQRYLLGKKLTIFHVHSLQQQSVGILLLVGNIHTSECIGKQHQRVYCHTLSSKGSEEDIARGSLLGAELQLCRCSGIEGIHRALQPLLCLGSLCLHWRVGKQAHGGVRCLCLSLCRKQRHINPLHGSIAIEHSTIHGNFKHKSTLHVCVYGIQVANLLGRLSPPPTVYPS